MSCLWRVFFLFRLSDESLYGNQRVEFLLNISYLPFLDEFITAQLFKDCLEGLKKTKQTTIAQIVKHICALLHACMF